MNHKPQLTAASVMPVVPLPAVISLGAGVQSSTLALMAAEGEFDTMPIAAIFSDTQDEPDSVYRWLDWLEPRLPFPVHRVTAGKLSDSALKIKRTKDGRTYAQTNVPVFTIETNGSVGKVPHRSCTRDYKIRPILKELRKIAGVKRGESSVVVESWIGISLDEMRRMKTSRDKWVTNRWPLVERRMTRRHCLEWMEARGYPKPPRSSCVFCPFHSNAEWRRLQNDEPKAFLEAVEFERSIQAAKSQSSNFKAMPYLHQSCKPLDSIDFRSDVERGQMTMWDDECEGMCGV